MYTLACTEEDQQHFTVGSVPDRKRRCVPQQSCTLRAAPRRYLIGGANRHSNCCSWSAAYRFLHTSRSSVGSYTTALPPMDALGEYDSSDSDSKEQAAANAAPSTPQSPPSYTGNSSLVQWEKDYVGEILKSTQHRIPLPLPPPSQVPFAAQLTQQGTRKAATDKR